MRVLLRHAWPLNVRELEHAMRAALALSPARIDVAHLPPAVRELPNAPGAMPSSPRRRALTAEQATLRDRLCALLTQHRGNISAVARELGKDRVQIRRWIKQFDIAVDELAAEE